MCHKWHAQRFWVLMKASGESVFVCYIRRLCLPNTVFYCMFQSVLIALSSVALHPEDFHNLFKEN